MIAGAHLAHQRSGHCCHPRRSRARGLRAFERRDALLEHGHGGIGEAGVLIARLFILEALFRA